MCPADSRHATSAGVLVALIAAALFMTASCAHADIYRSVNEDGVECFTDTPRGKGAAPFVREKKRGRSSAAPQRPSHRTPAEGRDPSPPPQTAAVPEESTRLPVRGYITSLTGLRHDPIDGALRTHQGVDIAIPEGTAVRPVAAGTVIFSGWRNGYGNTVVVQHADGMITIYAHHKLNIATEGDTVGRETAIALSGSTGRSTGPHLHFEAWKDGTNVTENFIPSDYPRRVADSGSRRHLGSDGIRRVLQADGSILFTNY